MAFAAAVRRVIDHALFASSLAFPYRAHVVGSPDKTWQRSSRLYKVPWNKLLGANNQPLVPTASIALVDKGKSRVSSLIASTCRICIA